MLRNRGQIMKPIIHSLLGLVLLAGLLACKKEQVSAPPTTDQKADLAWTKVTLEQSLHGQLKLDHGWAVTCKSTDQGVYDATLTRGDRQVKLSFMRDARFYGVDDTHVLIHNIWYSNEDQLLIVDLAGKDAEPATIGHPDAETFVHTHYRIDGRTVDGVVGIEYQYAGNEGEDHPRQRTVTLPANNLSQVKYGPWQEIDTSQIP